MNKTDMIKNEIKRQFRSIREFAKVINMPYSTLIGALKKDDGIYTMEVENVIKICNGLGINIKILTPDDDYDLSVDDYVFLKKLNSLNKEDREALNYLLDHFYEKNDLEESN